MNFDYSATFKFKEGEEKLEQKESLSHINEGEKNSSTFTIFKNALFASHMHKFDNETFVSGGIKFGISENAFNVQSLLFNFLSNPIETYNNSFITLISSVKLKSPFYSVDLNAITHLESNFQFGFGSKFTFNYNDLNHPRFKIKFAGINQIKNLEQKLLISLENDKQHLELVQCFSFPINFNVFATFDRSISKIKHDVGVSFSYSF